MVQSCPWPSRVETYQLYLVACWCHSFACQHVELGLHWDPPWTAIWVWYGIFLTNCILNLTFLSAVKANYKKNNGVHLFAFMIMDNKMSIFLKYGRTWTWEHSLFVLYSSLMWPFFLVLASWFLRNSILFITLP